MDLPQIILSGFLASLAWFIIGGGLYLNPFVAKIYKNLEASPGFKKWQDNKKYLLNMYFLGNLVQCLLFALVYSFIQSIFPESLFLKTFYFGLILIAIKILPRLIDMWLQTTYPNKLLLVEVINGAIGSFVMAFVITFIIK